MIGIVSCYFKMNYGSMLQSFATQAILDNWGIENETINIDGIKHEIARKRKKYYMKNLFNIPMYRAKKGFVRHIIQRKMDPRGFGADINTRNKAFKDFEKKYYQLSKPCNSMEHLTETCKSYSNILLGSDQLWLPVNIVGDYYTLNFVPSDVNKITYATSFGVSTIPRYLHKKTIDFLNRIDYLSVREQSGQKIINELIGNEVPVVCDPTLLLSKEQWLGFSNPEKNIINKPYIFCYFLGNNRHHRDFVTRLKKKTGFSIVTLKHTGEYIPSDNSFGDYAPYDVGPFDFVNLINNAEYICTDSFHGTTFSVLLQKNFYSFRRFSNNTKESTNSRVEDFLYKLGQEKRILSGTEAVDELDDTTEYSMVQDQVDNWKNLSMDYLKNALGMEMNQ